MISATRLEYGYASPERAGRALTIRVRSARTGDRRDIHDNLPAVAAGAPHDRLGGNDLKLAPAAAGEDEPRRPQGDCWKPERIGRGWHGSALLSRTRRQDQCGGEVPGTTNAGLPLRTPPKSRSGVAKGGDGEAWGSAISA